MPAKLINGRGGLPAVYVKNNSATAEIMLLGAHLISFKPAKSTELIWMSKDLLKLRHLSLLLY